MGHARTTAVAAALILLSACEGLFTGSRELDQPLRQAEDGSFAPVTMQLTPQMNPMAFNLRGETIPNIAESTRWNTYRATLTHNGATVASGEFSVNNPGAREQEHGGPFARTMFYVSVAQAGEYQLAIAPTKPKEITIESPRIEVRRNVQPPATNAGGAGPPAR